MTIPLATVEFADKSPDKLCPIVIVNGQRLRALAHYTAPMPTRSLRQRVGNAAAYTSEVVAAMDVVVSGV